MTVVVAVAPHHAAVLAGAFVPGDATLAELLDVDVSSDAACGASAIAGSGTVMSVPTVVARRGAWRSGSDGVPRARRVDGE